QLCEQACKAGVPTCVHRLGRITGSRRHPSINPQDILWRVARASVSVQAWPDLNFEETWTPVDEAAETLTTLILSELCWRASSDPQVFHLAQDEPVHLSRLRDTLLQLGYALPTVAVP